MKETRRFERVLHHPVESVWEAITAERDAWLPGSVDRAGEPAADVVVESSEPPHRLVCTMGEETLRWELSAIPEGCLLVLETESIAANDTVALAA